MSSLSNHNNNNDKNAEGPRCCKKDTKTIASSYFGVGIVGGTKDAHHGTLLRSSYQYGASFICTVGGKHYKHTMRDTDTSKAWCYIPVFSYPSVEKLKNCAPYDCPWVACFDGPGGTPLKEFKHPKRALYLFPGDDTLLLQKILPNCRYHILPPRSSHYNEIELTTSPILGSMVLYDRYAKQNLSKIDGKRKANQIPSTNSKSSKKKQQ